MSQVNEATRKVRTSKAVHAVKYTHAGHFFTECGKRVGFFSATDATGEAATCKGCAKRVGE